MSAYSGTCLKPAAIVIGSSSATTFGAATSGNGVVQTLHRGEQERNK
jgi:hypothetical protein